MSLASWSEYSAYIAYFSYLAHLLTCIYINKAAGTEEVHSAAHTRGSLLNQK